MFVAVFFVVVAIRDHVSNFLRVSSCRPNLVEFPGGRRIELDLHVYHSQGGRQAGDMGDSRSLIFRQADNTDLGLDVSSSPNQKLGPKSCG